MPETDEPDLDHVRRAMREHDERVEEDATRPPDEDEQQDEREDAPPSDDE